MARNSFAVTAVAVLAVVGVGSCFLTGLPQGSQPPRAAPNAVEHEMPQPSMAGNSWAAPLLSFGAALGLIFGVVAAKPARAITAEQFSPAHLRTGEGLRLGQPLPHRRVQRHGGPREGRLSARERVLRTEVLRSGVRD